MIDAGYMAKRSCAKPDLFNIAGVDDIYSVSGCISEDFADYIDFWAHNGYWLFDSPKIILDLAKDHSIDLHGTPLFFYQVYEYEWSEQDHAWRKVSPEPSFPTNVTQPTDVQLEGFDVATFSCGNSAECSPLSCNGLGAEIAVNSHCLIPSFDDAKRFLEEGKFDNSEPGPFRIFAVYCVDWR
ncbi:MAG: hypothetical protein EXR70_08435 [Deltaproteobacteria bacterium]|nr:hypothetical protein [Deltaproteobacteria bacterium]